jgi:hypothetical protein
MSCHNQNNAAGARMAIGQNPKGEKASDSAAPSTTLAR